MSKTTEHPVSGSFRDPSGHLFFREGLLYRQVNPSYSSNYDLLVSSGLYDQLVGKQLLVAHDEVDLPIEGAYKFLRPELIPLISYPYEWSFSQLKDAALATLRIQELAIHKGMALKDASAFNIQFNEGRPVFIDTLSFEAYREGEPWVGYRQFCQHFLAPLALMSLSDIRLGSLSAKYIDGVPLDLASQLLPGKSWLKFGLLTHLHLHARSQKAYEGETKAPVSKGSVSKTAMLGIVDSLKSIVKGLSWKPAGTTWGDYYSATNYSDAAFDKKKELVDSFIGEVSPEAVWDLGANTGVFSRLAGDRGIPTVAFDIDPAAVELNYLHCRKNKYTKMLPLLMDLSNPSPALGWLGEERHSFFQRGPVDLVLALALIHHLAIGNNVPLPGIAEFFSRVCRNLVVEFVPKSDSQVRRMLAVREDVFPDYRQEQFEAVFESYFHLVKSVPVAGSERTLYLMTRKAH
ncbi:MAG: class I SAM-dependent methyltransferase [Acidobacteriota bacterium]|nr:MAG: class I SAM-dependent methyltransferase [Acidobacteriota bacterium]